MEKGPARARSERHGESTPRLRGTAALAAGFLSLSAVAPAASATFPQLIEQWSVLSLSGAPRPVAGVRLSAGRLTLTLVKGSAAPVMAGDQVAGIFFRGEGTLDFLSDDPVEASGRLVQHPEEHGPHDLAGGEGAPDPGQIRGGPVARRRRDPAAASGAGRGARAPRTRSPAT